MLRRKPDIGAKDLQEIGRGGQSTVYSAIDPQFGKVAVKVFHLTSEEGANPFEREREVLDRLMGIESIVQIYRDGVTQFEEPYLVMQYLAGGSLQDLVEENGPMPWAQATRYLSVVSRAVHEAHHHGIVHADLKPSNILLDESGNPYVSDFGISKIVDNDRTVTTRLMLTPNYAAPEIFEDAEESASSDIYALGATAAALVAGEPPFQSTGKSGMLGVIRRIMDDRPPTLTEFGAPIRLTNAVRRAMDKDPARRFETAGELGNAFDDCLSGRGADDVVLADELIPPKETAEPLPPGESRPVWKTRRALVAGVGAAAVLVLAGLFALLRPEPQDPLTVSVEVDGSGDYATVSDALTALPPSSTIELGSGIYEEAETILLGKPINIVGVDQSETELVGLGSGPVLEADGVEFTIEDLAVSYAGEGPDVDVVSAADSQLRLSNVAVSGGTRHGIFVDGESTGLIEDSLFSQNDGSGIVQGGETSLVLASNVSNDNLSSGYAWQGSAGGEVSQSSAERNDGDGFRFDTDGEIELGNNTASDNRGSGFAWAASASGTARNNTAALNSDSGFVALDNSRPHLIGNKASENDQSGFAWLNQSTGDAADNESTDNGPHGFVVSEMAGPSLSKSEASGNDGSGFMWSSSGDGALLENTSERNAQDGFSFAAEEVIAEVAGNLSVANSRNGFAWSGDASGAATGNVARENAANGFDLGQGSLSDLKDNSATENEGYGVLGVGVSAIETAGNTATDNVLGDWQEFDQSSTVDITPQPNSDSTDSLPESAAPRPTVDTSNAPTSGSTASTPTESSAQPTSSPPTASASRPTSSPPTVPAPKPTPSPPTITVPPTVAATEAPTTPTAADPPIVPSGLVVSSGTVVGFEGKCLDIRGAGTGNGTVVQIWDCDGVPNQNWKLTEAGELRGYGNKCLDVRGPSTNNGTSVQIWDCVDVPQQRWTFNSSGELVGYAGLCLDVRGPSRDNGTPVQVWDCVDVPQQQWKIS